MRRRIFVGQPVRLFLLSRAALWAIAATTLFAFGSHLNPNRGRWDDPLLHDTGDGVDVWARWDSLFYLRIATDGYEWPSSRPAFFPLYPAAVRLAGVVTGGHYIIAAVLVSLAAGAVACALLYRLALPSVGAEGATRSVLFLAVFPTALFLGAVYSESLFLALALGSFLAAREGSLRGAGLLAGLAVLTRLQGLALLPAVGLLAWRRRGGRGVVDALLPAAALALVYPIMLWIWIGEPFAFVHGQDVWERRLSPFGPFGGLAAAAGDADLVEIGFAVAMLALAAIAWRRLGAPHGLYAIGALAIPMSVPSDRLGGLYSFPRLALVAFPCFIALAAVTARRPLLASAYVLASGALLAYYVVRWSLWNWVA